MIKDIIGRNADFMNRSLDEVIADNSKLYTSTRRYLDYLVTYSYDFDCPMYEITENIINNRIIWNSKKSPDRLMFSVTEKMRATIEEIKDLINITMTIPFFRGDLYKLRELFSSTNDLDYENYIYDNLKLIGIGDFIHD